MSRTARRIESKRRTWSGARPACVALLVAIAACGDAPPTADEPRSSLALTQDDYDVMSAAIRATLEIESFAGPPDSAGAQRPIRQVVIVGQPDTYAPRNLRLIEADSGAPMDPATAADYAAKTDKPPFEPRFAGFGAYELLSVERMTAIFDDRGWTGFYERFPGAPGFIALSRVGFDRDRTEAVVHVFFLRGGLWGHSVAYLFRKENHEWVRVGYQHHLDI